MLHQPSRSRVSSRGAAALLALTLGLCTAPPARGQLALDPGAPHPGLDALLAAHDGAALVRGIATFAAPPSALEAGALRALGLAAQPMANLPLALVFGPVAAMEAAVATGAARDVYPDERVELFDTASADAMGSALPRAELGGWSGAAGYTSRAERGAAFARCAVIRYRSLHGSSVSRTRPPRSGSGCRSNVCSPASHRSPICPRSWPRWATSRTDW